MKYRISPKAVGIMSVAAYVLMITMNALASILPINGLTTADVSYRYGSLFTPAGITFSIWLVIYLLLLVYTVYQTGTVWRHTVQQAKLIGRINWLYILTCLLNAAWILCWHYEKLLLSLLVMFALLATLIVIYLRIRGMLRSVVPRSQSLCVMAPFSAYLGWITVATLANAATYLISIGWNFWGLSQVTWTIILILATVFITLMIQRYYRDLVFTAVIVWALTGILIQHITTYKMSYTLIIVTAVMSIAAVLIGVVLIFSRKKRVRRKAKNLRHSRRKIK